MATVNLATVGGFLQSEEEDWREFGFESLGWCQQVDDDSNIGGEGDMDMSIQECNYMELELTQWSRYRGNRSSLRTLATATYVVGTSSGGWQLPYLVMLGTLAGWGRGYSLEPLAIWFVSMLTPPRVTTKK